MTYTISNGILTVTFNTLGGTFASIKNAAGREYLWQPDPAFWGGQAPICFPICGSLRNNTAVTIEGKTLAMPRHGIVKDREFEMAAQTEDSITFRLTADDQLKEKAVRIKYPKLLLRAIQDDLLNQYEDDYLREVKKYKDI